jgi:hypothetical protein
MSPARFWQRLALETPAVSEQLAVVRFFYDGKRAPAEAEVNEQAGIAERIVH